MILFNHIFEVQDIMFYSVFIGSACFISGSFIKNIFFSNKVETVIETPTTDSGVDTIRAITSDNLVPSPTLHHLTQGNLRHLQNILDTKRDFGIQTESNLTDAVTQTTSNLTDVATQTISNNVNVGIQSEVLFNKLEQGIQTIDLIKNPGLKLNIPDDLVTPEMISQMTKHNEILNSGLDLHMIEAYATIPELIQVADSIHQFYPFF